MSKGRLIIVAKIDNVTTTISARFSDVVEYSLNIPVEFVVFSIRIYSCDKLKKFDWLIPSILCSMKPLPTESLDNWEYWGYFDNLTSFSPYDVEFIFITFLFDSSDSKILSFNLKDYFFSMRFLANLGSSACWIYWG